MLFDFYLIVCWLISLLIVALITCSFVCALLFGVVVVCFALWEFACLLLLGLWVYFGCCLLLVLHLY